MAFYRGGYRFRSRGPQRPGYDRPYYGYGRGGYYGASMYGGGPYGHDYTGAWGRGGYSEQHGRDLYGRGRRRYGRDFPPPADRYRGAGRFTGGAYQA